VTYHSCILDERILIPSKHVAGEFRLFGHRWVVHRSHLYKWATNYWAVTHVLLGLKIPRVDWCYTPEDAVTLAALELYYQGKAEVDRAVQKVRRQRRKRSGA
jgi:hypothetical protein